MLDKLQKRLYQTVGPKAALSGKGGVNFPKLAELEDSKNGGCI